MTMITTTANGRLSAGGALAAAFAAAASWLCCLPFALGALGAVGSGLAHFLGPLQPYITALSLLLLAVAFFQAYRHAPVRACAADGRCDQNGVRRTRRFLWIATVLTAVLITVPYWLDWVIFWTL